MNADGDRRYLSTHPWITLGFKMDRLSPATWALLGEAAAKCEHLAGSAMPPEFARELNQVSLERGAHGTASIEGNSLSEEDVRAIVRGESRIPPSRAYQKQEIENIVDLFNDIARDCLEGHPAPLSPERLKEQHARLMVGQPEKEDVVPGEFRTHDVVVGRYRGAPPEDCDYLVRRLCDWLNGELEDLGGSDDVLRDPRVFVLAALAHLHLAWIHPFGDGNGRISRLLEFEILLRASIPVLAAHLLSDHYNKTRDHYYAILERTSRADGYPMEDFVHYATEGLVDGLREQLQKVRNMQMTIMWQSYVHERFHGSTGSTRPPGRGCATSSSSCPRVSGLLPMTSSCSAKTSMMLIEARRPKRFPAISMRLRVWDWWRSGAAGGCDPASRSWPPSCRPGASSEPFSSGNVRAGRLENQLRGATRLGDRLRLSRPRMRRVPDLKSRYMLD